MRIGIAGAGIMGRLLAWELLCRGHAVTLFERDLPSQSGGASHTAAGMLAPFCEAEVAEPLVLQLGRDSPAHWAALAAALGDIGFRASGTLVIAHPGDRAELERFLRLLDARLEGAEMTGGWLDRAALLAREPGLEQTRFEGALWLPGEASVDNGRALAALERRLVEGGAVLHVGAPAEVLEPGWLRSEGRVCRFDWVADCRGMGAREVLPGLRGVRGELLEVLAPEVELRHMLRLQHPRYRLYLVPRGEGRYLIGATQIESEDYSPISVRSALELLSALYSLHPGFAEARIVGSRSNCRPALPDNLPKVQVQPGLLRINGLFRHGFLVAPAIAREVGRFLEEGVAYRPAWSGLFSFSSALAGEPAE